MVFYTAMKNVFRKLLFGTGLNLEQYYRYSQNWFIISFEVNYLCLPVRSGNKD